MGLFTSSPKVTLHLSADNEQQPAFETGFGSWECEVCAYRNPPGLSPSAARICGLCGVPRSSVPAPTRISSTVASPAPSTSSLPYSISTSTLPHSRKPSSIACPACTFLNHPSLRICEICATELPKPHQEVKSAPATRPASPKLVDEDPNQGSVARMIKLSFRKGGDKPFYVALKRSLKGRAWEGARTLTRSDDANRSGICELSLHYSLTFSDIYSAGIIHTVETTAQNRDMSMSDALQDLEALMIKAKDMVRLAAELNERLTASSTTTTNPYSSSFSSTLISSTSAEPEEATFIRSSLSQLGLQMENTPVTLDMMKDERKWIEELARELASILQGSERSASGMMKEKGIIALDEVWGGWNRARGVGTFFPPYLHRPLLHTQSSFLFQPSYHPQPSSK